MSWMIVATFIVGYTMIVFEHRIGVNKAASAILAGVVCWTIYAVAPHFDVGPSTVNLDHIDAIDRVTAVVHESAQLSSAQLSSERINLQLMELTGEIAGILFFLMGAMMIVEVVDAHDGFQLVTRSVRPKHRTQLLWATSWLAFAFSSVLDNLTTSIVMVSLLRKIVADREDRMLFAGIVVVAANAGGAWTVIGDVTTTMLWINHRIEALSVMKALLLPSLACLLAPLLILTIITRGTQLKSLEMEPAEESPANSWQRSLIFAVGMGGLLSVPVFKTWTHLPPYLGMTLALSILWITADLIHKRMPESQRPSSSILSMLQRVDMSSILFFLGILLAVGSLAATGILTELAEALERNLPNSSVVAVSIGLASALIDNVPLVAAGIQMYSFPINDPFWMLLALCAGTGGSCLIIGSASGVAIMGLERIEFGWYLRRVAPLALLGYAAAVAVFFLQRLLV